MADTDNRVANKAEVRRVSVKMTGQTVHMHNGNLYRLWPDMVVTVDEATAERWYNVGLADYDLDKKEAKAAVPMANHRAMAQAAEERARSSDVRNEVLRTDLRIAARHGNIHAARQLIEAGEPVDYTGSPFEGTPPPLDLTTQGAPARAQAAPGAVREGDAGDGSGGENEENDTPPPTGRRQTTGQSARANLAG